MREGGGLSAAIFIFFLFSMQIPHIYSLPHQRQYLPDIPDHPEIIPDIPETEVFPL